MIKKLLQQKIIYSTFLLASVSLVYSHGTVTSPPSRVYNCYLEGPESPQSDACKAAVAMHGPQHLYDWNAVNQGEANGNHTEHVMDGNLASGGMPNIYGGLDQIRTDWVATSVVPGNFTITWTNSAPHATQYYDVYITKEGWTSDQALSWDSLELLKRTDPSVAASSVDIPVVLPQRTGKHVIYSVWQRSDSPEAFYSTSDVDFGGTLSVDKFEDSDIDFDLEPNFPNPFNSSSTIVYTLGKNLFVTLKVYDIYGKEVEVLVNDSQSVGKHEVTFEGKGLSDGVYFYTLRAGNAVETKRMILQR